MEYEIKEERYRLSAFDGRSVIRCKLDRVKIVSGEENVYIQKYFEIITGKIKSLISGSLFESAKNEYNVSIYSGERFSPYEAMLNIKQTFSSNDIASFVICFSVIKNASQVEHKMLSAVFNKDGFVPPPASALFLRRTEVWAIGDDGRDAIFSLNKERRVLELKKTFKRKRIKS